MKHQPINHAGAQWRIPIGLGSGRLGLTQFQIKRVEQRFRIQLEQRGVVAHKPARIHRRGKDRPVATFQCLNLIGLHFRLIHNLRNGESL